jgi:thiol-disulfide isomerase/thioredoxin
MKITEQTRIEVSHREDEFFQVNFNLTFPSISCSWISVDYVDIVGHRKTNISDAEVHKHTLHGNYVASAVRQYDQPEIEYAHANESTKQEIQSYQEMNGPKVLTITEESFQNIIASHRVAILNFYAPWCPYCVALAPIYEAAAALVHKRLQNTNQIVFANVNCVDKDNFQLCRQQHIQVFPTVRIFRDGSNNMNARMHMHEEYRGPRTVEAISDFSINVFNAVTAKEAPGELSTPKAEGTKAPKTADGRRGTYSEYSTFGCVVSGNVKVSRIPGTILFLPTAEGHNFHTEAINMSHVVHHLSFGNDGSSQDRPKRKKSRRNKYELEDGAYSGDSDGTLFVSLAGRITHEHFLKIVQSVHEYLGGYVRETYEYTINSNLYPTPGDDLPSVKMVWDIWPMEVINTQTRKPLIEGICQMVGLLGGVYAAFLVFERLVGGTWRELMKSSQGKLG